MFMVLPVKTLRWVLSLRSQERFSRKCLVWMTAGQISELHRQIEAVESPAIMRAK
jgi:hypothetical protein